MLRKYQSQGSSMPSSGGGTEGFEEEVVLDVNETTDATTEDIFRTDSTSGVVFIIESNTLNIWTPKAPINCFKTSKSQTGHVLLMGYS